MAPQLVPLVDGIMGNVFVVVGVICVVFSVGRMIILYRKYLISLEQYDHMQYTEDILFLEKVRMKFPEVIPVAQNVTRPHPDPAIEALRLRLRRANRQNIMLIIALPLTFFLIEFVTNMLLYFG